MQETENTKQEQLSISPEVKKKILTITTEEGFLALSKFINLFSVKRLELSLMSKNSFNDIWSRHILDSIQLNPFIKEVVVQVNSQTRNVIIDLGSGNGFPIIPIIVDIAAKTT
jgi:16S rRNA G527 N7-methylase RsmG